MKVEGGGVATGNAASTVLLHKIRVKQEPKECYGLQANSNSRSQSSSPPSPRSGVAIGAIATITISSAAQPELATTTAAQPKHGAANADPSPVDLDLKGKHKESSRGDGKANGTESRNSSSRSPSSSPASQKQQQQQPDGLDEPQAVAGLKTEAATPDEATPAATNGASARCVSAVFAADENLKRLLGTTLQFAIKLSPETGDTVKGLVLALLSGSMSAEDFHSAVQEVTNYPLRDHVLPCLKQTLPSLQRDLNAAARAENQSCAQYLRANEVAVFGAVLAPSADSTGELFAEHAMPVLAQHQLQHHQHHYQHRTGLHAPPHLAYAHPLKRRASDSLYYENGAAFEEVPGYAKRWAHPAPATQHQLHPPDLPYWYAQPVQHGPAGIPSLVQYPAPPPHLHPPHQLHSANSGSGGGQNGNGSLDDEWKNIHVMLNCILGMVDKTKRALAILQKRGCTSPAAASSAPASSVQSNGPQPTNGPQQQQPQQHPEAADGSFKRLSGEIVAQTIRATEDRVAEVKRRAEEAVQEVKRVAVAEVQRAVAAAVAESRASERLRSQRYMDNLPQQQQQQQSRAQYVRPSPFPRLQSEQRTNPGTTSSSDELEKEAHLPTSMPSSCWNCGRTALETCGGCGVARYCGSFCQHRDWEAGGHHATCSSTASSANAQRAASSTPSPPSKSTGNESAAPTASN